MPAQESNARFFWVVYCPTGPHPPTVEHDNVRSARAEAERLARANPGQRFYVLVSVSVCEFNPVSWTDLMADEEPPF